MSVCPDCGAPQPDSATCCDECGARLGGSAPTVSSGAAPAQPAAARPRTCPSCGASVMLGEAFCDNCGAALDSPTLLYGEEIEVPKQLPEPSAPPALEQAGLLICSNCGTQLEPGRDFCDMCGAPVGEAPSASPETVRATPPYPEPTPPPPVESPRLAPEETYPAGPPVMGRLVVQRTRANLLFPPGKTEIVVGREDPISDIFPDIDLTDQGADEAGVSRKHARLAIEGSQVLIEDLKSTNHTYVNQQRLTPGEPHPLSDGDEIRLGGLKLTFHSRGLEQRPEEIEAPAGRVVRRN